MDLIFIDLPGVTQEQMCPLQDESIAPQEMPSSCFEDVNPIKKEAESIAKASSSIKADYETAKDAAAASFKKESILKEPTAVEVEWSEFKNAKKFRQICELLKMMNYNILRQSGSHVIFGRDEDGEIVVPRHGKNLGTGLLNSIYKQVTGKDS